MQLKISKVKERKVKGGKGKEREGRTKDPDRKIFPYHHRFLVYLCPIFI